MFLLGAGNHSHNTTVKIFLSVIRSQHRRSESNSIRNTSVINHEYIKYILNSENKIGVLQSWNQTCAVFIHRTMKCSQIFTDSSDETSLSIFGTT